MKLNEQLSEAITTATIAHDGTYDRHGKPYILHPLHLMSKFIDDIELATIAVLHDVVEDTYVTLDHFRNKKYSKRVIRALDLLTRKEDDLYIDYINNMSGSMDAIRVKIEDLKHNSDITRTLGTTGKDLERLRKYHNAYLRLSRAKLDLMDLGRY